MLETILNKLTIKELGNHISNYINLYIKPIDSWKKAAASGNSGFDFVILHLVYFTLLILLIIKDLYLAIPLCIIEIIITLVPLIIFIFPYKISAFLFKKELNWKQLFRLLLVIKLQTIPIFFILHKFANYTQSEDLFILVDNFIWIIWIGFIAIFPIVSNLKFSQKIILLILNYTSFISFFLLSITLFSNINVFGKLGDDIMLLTPDKEYSNNNINSSNSNLFIQDSLYLLIGEQNNQKNLIIKKTQFVDLQLSIYYNKTVRNKSIKNIIELDSIICSKDNSRISKKDSLQTLYYKEEINKRVLDSLRNKLTSNIENDLKLTDSLKKYAKFKSNRNYYKALNLYLTDYNKSYIDNNRISEVLKIIEKKEYLKIDNGEYLIMLNINESAYDKFKKPYLELKEKLEIRAKKSNYLMGIIFWPLEKILEKMDFY